MSMARMLSQSLFSALQSTLYEGPSDQWLPSLSNQGGSTFCNDYCLLNKHSDCINPTLGWQLENLDPILWYPMYRHCKYISANFQT